MAKFCGKDFLLQVEDQVVPSTFNTIGAIRDTSISINNEQVDVTDKSNMPARQLLGECGVNSMTISGSGQFSDEEAISDLHAKALSGAVITCKLVSGNGDSYEGSFQVASFERSGPYNSVEEYSITLESAASITYA